MPRIIKRCKRCRKTSDETTFPRPTAMFCDPCWAVLEDVRATSFNRWANDQIDRVRNPLRGPRG